GRAAGSGQAGAASGGRPRPAHGTATGTYAHQLPFGRGGGRGGPRRLVRVAFAVRRAAGLVGSAGTEAAALREGQDQPGVAVVGDEVVGPAHQGGEPVAEAGQVDQVQE